MTKEPVRRHVVPHPKGWAVRNMMSERSSSIHATQEEAIEAGTRILRNLGGGELVIQDER